MLCQLLLTYGEVVEVAEAVTVRLEVLAAELDTHR
jgi:hypothetical protein